MAEKLTPPADPLGQSITVRFSVQLQDKRRRDSGTVSEVVGRWVARHARRTFPTYYVEGWSTDVYPGQTYREWWFGSVEVYLRKADAKSFWVNADG